MHCTARLPAGLTCRDGAFVASGNDTQQICLYYDTVVVANWQVLHHQHHELPRGL